MCFEELHERVVCTFPCQHAICLHCLLSLHAPSCPLCRRDLIPCLPLRARLPVLQFVRRRLFANQASLSDGDALGALAPLGARARRAARAAAAARPTRPARPLVL